MSTMIEAYPGTAQAVMAANSAAGEAGVTLRELSGLDDVLQASTLFDEVWQVDGESLLPVNLARAIAHAGGYFAGAFSGRKMIGAVLGFVGFRDGIHLHSHVLAVIPDAERRGVGFALKQHQRAWALQHGLDQIYWTFDPLVRRNAYFNLCKLGAEILDYHVDFYGQMTDGVNAGDESDRALVKWALTSDRAVEGSQSQLPQPDIKSLVAAGAETALDEDSQGAPRLSEVDGDVLLCRIPSDIVAVRRVDPKLALSWRRALRDCLGGAVSDGYLAKGISKSGWYVLERREPTN